MYFLVYLFYHVCTVIVIIFLHYTLSYSTTLSIPVDIFIFIICRKKTYFFWGIIASLMCFDKMASVNCFNQVIAEYLQKVDPKSDDAKRDWVSIYDECASVLYQVVYLNFMWAIFIKIVQNSSTFELDFTKNILEGSLVCQSYGPYVHFFLLFFLSGPCFEWFDNLHSMILFLSFFYFTLPYVI